MERFAADALTAQHDAHVRSAIKAKVPWTEIVEEYGVTLEDIMRIAGYKGSTMVAGAPKQDEIIDAREQFEIVNRRTRR